MDGKTNDKPDSMNTMNHVESFCVLLCHAIYIIVHVHGTGTGHGAYIQFSIVQFSTLRKKLNKLSIHTEVDTIVCSHRTNKNLINPLFTDLLQYSRKYSSNV